MEITRTSQISGISHTLDIPVTEEQMKLWDNGKGPLIQNCFPNISADDREFILTGATKEEWDELFPEEDDPTYQSFKDD